MTAADNPIIEAANPIIEELMPQCLRVKVLSGKLIPATTPASEIARITRTRLKKFLGSLIRPNYSEDSDNLVFPL